MRFELTIGNASSLDYASGSSTPAFRSNVTCSGNVMRTGDLVRLNTNALLENDKINMNSEFPYDFLFNLNLQKTLMSSDKSISKWLELQAVRHIMKVMVSKM